MSMLYLKSSFDLNRLGGDLIKLDLISIIMRMHGVNADLITTI